MSHLRFCLLAFLVLGVVAGFASQDVSNDICDHETEPGSESVKLSFLEDLIKKTKIKLESLGNDVKAKVECLKEFVEVGLKSKKTIIENIVKMKMKAWEGLMESVDKKDVLKKINNIFEGIIKPKENMLEMLKKGLNAKENTMKDILKRIEDTKETWQIQKEKLEKHIKGANLKKNEMKEMLGELMTKHKEEMEKMLETKIEGALGDKREYFDNILESLKKNTNDAKDDAKDVLGKWKKLLGKKSEGPKQVSCNSDILNQFKEPLQLIFPGTKWCGDGDKAINDDDLGMLKELDKCCRAHDKCQENIAAGEVLGNLKNDGLFTKSSCSCDFKFFGCLKGTNCPIANQIGMTYFNILRPQCFQCKCPKDDCNTGIDKECLKSCKRYEWIDNANY